MNTKGDISAAARNQANPPLFHFEEVQFGASPSLRRLASASRTPRILLRGRSPPWKLPGPLLATLTTSSIRDAVPQPELNLYGDTARFRPTAVCQSRGLYTDSVLFP